MTLKYGSRACGKLYKSILHAHRNNFKIGTYNNDSKIIIEELIKKMNLNVKVVVIK